MIKVANRLFVGGLADYQSVKDDPSFYFIQACKFPCHKEAVGVVDKTHPEYLVAYRDNRMILNIVDSVDSRSFNRKQLVAAVNTINEKIEAGHKVLVHCNQGISRSPSIALLYLAAKGIINNESYLTAKNDFLELYPSFSPKRTGIESFLIRTWWSYFK